MTYSWKRENIKFNGQKNNFMPWKFVKNRGLTSGMFGARGYLSPGHRNWLSLCPLMCKRCLKDQYQIIMEWKSKLQYKLNIAKVSIPSDVICLMVQSIYLKGVKLLLWKNSGIFAVSIFLSIHRLFDLIKCHRRSIPNKLSTKCWSQQRI